MAVTIYEVAEKAGVSISTVSRVLNNNQGVQPETKEKILRVITELDFKPNHAARALAANEVKLIEVCFSWSSVKINLENAWYTGLFNGINEVVQEKKYGLLFNTISGVFDPGEIQRRVSQNSVDGVLLVSPYLRAEELIEVKNFEIPVVLIGSRVEDSEVDYVDCDNEKGVKKVVAHLVKLGHKKIAFITGEVKISTDAAERLNVFKKAMKTKRLKIPEDYIVGGDFGDGSGRKAMDQLLALKDRPTAVFASNDQMALGAWDSIQKAGLKVGKNIALVGFDDISPASAPPYSLTTVRQDYKAIGAQAARLLIEKARNPANWQPRHILVPTQLIIRQSSGSKKKQR